MIVTGDIYKILYEKIQEFGIKTIYNSWNPIKSELKEESIVIVTSTPIEPDVYWEKAFVHVNICIFDGTRYRLSKSSLGIERDDALKCSYVNLKILFEILNVM